MDIGTVVTADYVPQARVLARSVREHHPTGRFVALVLGGAARKDEPFEWVTPEAAGVDDLEERTKRYTPFELGCSLKPHLLSYLLEDSPSALYLDGDMRVYGPLTVLEDLLQRHEMVLTPHFTRPLPADRLLPREIDIMRGGVYNGGLIGMSRGAEAARFRHWWAEHLRTECRTDPKSGYFADQTWLDLAPSLVPSLQLVHDPAYNLGYWNLPGRGFEAGPDGYALDGEALRCFHFSGFDPHRPATLSTHQNRVEMSPALQQLCDEYAAELRAAGFDRPRRRRSQEALYMSAMRWYALAANRLAGRPRTG